MANGDVVGWLWAVDALGKEFKRRATQHSDGTWSLSDPVPASSGGGDASAANQQSQINLLQNILAAFGALATDSDLVAGLQALTTKDEAIRALLAGTLKNMEVPVQGVIDMPQPATPYPAGRAIEIYCTASGLVTFTYLDGSTRTRTVAIGFTTLPHAVTQWALPNGSNFAGTFCNLK